MTGTVFLLGLVYVIFFVVLLQGVGMALPVVIVLAGGLLVVQYWTSDRSPSPRPGRGSSTRARRPSCTRSCSGCA